MEHDQPTQDRDQRSQSENAGFSLQSLEAVRKKLLDLSKRNPLLNYRYQKNLSCANFTGELPNHFIQAFQENKCFTLLPVPEPLERELIEAGYIEVDSATEEKKALKPSPTAEQWAKQLGLPTTYDFLEKPVTQQGKNKARGATFQTLLYPNKLETRLRHIHNKATTAIEESGVNVLYLALGFLEWYEDASSDTPHLAPLFTLPVNLERGKLDRNTGIYRYTITLKNDDLLTNITLREKLANDFSLSLPSIEENTDLEKYFEQIKKTILHHKPRWKIRYQASLVVLSFAKQSIYQDLDPNTWPTNAAIINHPTIQQFFGANHDSESSAMRYTPEHAIDDIDQIHDHFPLIFDADSSQHSALIDAVRGENLVIEGPPGSGKSQTIANLIAASIANGKKVLFVAEKMAALNVVKTRLDKAGLGDFCLALHSHKANKKTILQNLEQRLSKIGHYPPASSIHISIARFEDLKVKLSHYATLINSQWKQTGLTLHKILNTATRYKMQLGLNPDDFHIAGINGLNCTESMQQTLVDNVRTLSNIYGQVSEQTTDGNISNHHWYGVYNTNIMGHQITRLKDYLNAWNENLVTLRLFWQKHRAIFALSMNADTSMATIQAVSQALVQLPTQEGGEFIEQLPQIIQHKEAFITLLTDYDYIHQQLNHLRPTLKSEALSDTDAPVALKAALTALQTLDTPPNCSPALLARTCKEMKHAEESAQTIHALFQKILPHLPISLQAILTVSDVGLHEFTTLVALIEKLPSTLWQHRNAIFDDPNLDGVLEQLTSKLCKLTPLHNDLLSHFNLDRLPSASTLKQYQAILANGRLFRHFSSDWRQTKKAVIALAASPSPNKKILIALLPRLIDYAEGVVEIDHINEESKMLGNFYCGAKTPIDHIMALREWYKSVNQEYGTDFGDRVAMGHTLLRLDSTIAMMISNESKKGLFDQIGRLKQAVTTYRQQFKGFKPITNPYSDLATPMSPLSQLRTILETSLTTLETYVLDASGGLDKLTDTINLLDTTQKRVACWQQAELTQKLVPTPLSLSTVIGDFCPNTLAACHRTLDMAKIIAPIPILLHSIRTDPSVSRYQALKDCSRPLQTLVATVHQSTEPFIKQGEVNLTEWMKTSKDTMTSLIARNQRALNHSAWLTNWLEYVKQTNKLSAQGLSKVIKHLELKNIDVNKLSDVVQLAIHHQLAIEALAEHEMLAEFSALDQTATREQFQEYDKEILQLQRQKIAYQASNVQPLRGIATGKVSSKTESALISHEVSKKTRHIALRNLLERAGNTIQMLYPCFMMSPMSVAQYLKPGHLDFDIVVMDEASQIRPEEALGAIARGASLVVVGDPKQLPPTNFFQKSTYEEDPDAVALEEVDSILDAVLPVFKNRRLRWHYRSRHEKLIAFSNYHFYNNDLILFPSPCQDTEEYGIDFHHITQGTCVGSRNIEEAKAVVHTAITLLEQGNDSIGIVAMNAAQCDEIDEQLGRLTKNRPDLKNAHEHEPLFVKNLENVQGDERDIIIISMTYNPKREDGRTAQRFGPIAQENGWRRLNVLFTRAKKRMLVFSSMESEDIKLLPTSKKGVQSLKAFLAYCKTGHLHNTTYTGKAPDSDFEIAVIKALENHGYECEPQLGISGYFLDIAVRDPGRPGRFLMGIECDGATYHSAKSTRDRDRLRQEILENLGWKIRRIWSTDWFKNPDAPLQPILRELDEMKTPVAKKVYPIDNILQQEKNMTETVQSDCL